MIKQVYYGNLLLFTADDLRNMHNIYIVRGRFDKFS